MSLLKTIRQQLGLAGTGANNFTLDASADNGTMKLARGNAGATTQDILTVSADGMLGAGVSPPQFANDLSLVTMAALQRALGSRSGQVSKNSTSTLTANDAGKEINLIAGAAVTTLPLLSSVVAGTVFRFVCTGQVGAVVQRGGTDSMSANGSAQTSFVLDLGDTLEVVSAGTLWLVVGGSARLKFAGVFGVSLAANGYQKLPSGLIIQWGVVSGVNNSAGVNVTFPLAFPTGAFSVVATHQAPGSGPGSRIVEAVIRSSTYFDVYGNTTANAVYWMAIGR